MELSRGLLCLMSFEISLSLAVPVETDWRESHDNPLSHPKPLRRCTNPTSVQYLAEHSDSIVDLRGVGEDTARQLLQEILDRQKLTYPLAKVFMDCGDDELSRQVAGSSSWSLAASRASGSLSESLVASRASGSFSMRRILLVFLL